MIKSNCDIKTHYTCTYKDPHIQSTASKTCYNKVVFSQIITDRQTNILFDIYNNAHYVIQKGLQYSAHDSD